MSAIPPPPAAHEVAHQLSAAVARAVQSVLPKGFHGRFEIAADRGVVRPEDVEIRFRPPTRPPQKLA